MKSDVNFFHDGLKPKVELLTLAFCIIVWSFAIGILVTVYQDYQSELAQYKIEKTNAEQQVDVAKQAYDMLVASQVTEDEDPLLVATAERLTNDLTYYQNLNAEITGDDIVASTDFSALMVALAEYHHPDISLSHIYFTDTELTLEGVTNSAAAIPLWLEGLGQSDVFNGRRFSHTRLFENKHNELNFKVSSGAIFSRQEGQ